LAALEHNPEELQTFRTRFCVKDKGSDHNKAQIGGKILHMTIWMHHWRELGLMLSVAAGALIISEPAASQPSAAGVWKQVDEHGKVGALVTISEQSGVYVGRLSKLFLGPKDDPDPICTRCPGDKLNQPILGLTFIEGMKQSGLDYEDGTILDPETGDIYHAKMSLSPDGNELNVRGYVGLPVFGRTQTWTRVE
jgi:uncharacterized protein (DUF2147 family)